MNSMIAGDPPLKGNGERGQVANNREPVMCRELRSSFTEFVEFIGFIEFVGSKYSQESRILGATSKARKVQGQKHSQKS